MAGIYLHIPFCKQACHYCNFHFSTSLKYKKDVIDALLKEIELQKNYLNGVGIESVYFGGGTPSLLEADEIELIFATLNRFHTISPSAEITLEANPDDLKPSKIKAFRQTPINRFSIGIQSFWEEDLQFMNRAHNASEAKDCIKLVQDAGFENITVDLIYGTPTMSNEHWEVNLDTVFEFNIPHLSCYCLTVEPKTALAHFVKIGKAEEVAEEQSAQQFTRLVERATEQGYEHYEISNFALPNRYAVHNSNYWKSKPYLGLGPSAHSFNGATRQWNVANNAHYIKALNKGQLNFELEELSKADQFNEYLMTGLRTKWGVDLEQIKTWGTEMETHFLQVVQPFLKAKKIIQRNSVFTLSTEGRFLADGIIAALFY